MTDSRREANSTRRSAVTRRQVLSAGAAAAGLASAPALSQATSAGVDWTPRLLTGGQAALLSRLCDLLLPRTATPGALDAGVPEYIDLAVSLAEPEDTNYIIEVKGGFPLSFTAPCVSQIGPLEVAQVKPHRVVEHDVK